MGWQKKNKHYWELLELYILKARLQLESKFRPWRSGDSPLSAMYCVLPSFSSPKQGKFGNCLKKEQQDNASTLAANPRLSWQHLPCYGWFSKVTYVDVVRCFEENKTLEGRKWDWYTPTGKDCTWPFYLKLILQQCSFQVWMILRTWSFLWEGSTSGLSWQCPTSFVISLTQRCMFVLIVF